MMISFTCLFCIYIDWNTQKVKVKLQCTHRYPLHNVRQFPSTYCNVAGDIGYCDYTDVVIKWIGLPHCIVERYASHPVFYRRNPDHEGSRIVVSRESPCGSEIVVATL